MKQIFVTCLFALLGFNTYAQVNLKELREKPETNIGSQDTVKPLQIKAINVPIPKLDLEVNYWKHWSKFGLNLNQAQFTDNWNAGGVNSTAVSGLMWHKSEYTKDNFSFLTEFDLKYGKIKNSEQIAKKNNDRIFWDNKVSYKLAKYWAVYFSLTFESQFDLGYNYKKDAEGKEIINETVSGFMAPAYFTESLGLEFKPDNTFSVRLGTGTARQTLVLNDKAKPLTVAEYAERYPDNNPITEDQERWGIKAGENFKNDLAFQLTANLDRNISKNLNLKSRYNLFADYKEIKDPDHRLEATLTAKVTSLVNVSLNGILMYDSDQDKDVQASQSLALGLVYTLPR